MGPRLQQTSQFTMDITQPLCVVVQASLFFVVVGSLAVRACLYMSDHVSVFHWLANHRLLVQWLPPVMLMVVNAMGVLLGS